MAGLASGALWAENDGRSDARWRSCRGVVGDSRRARPALWRTPPALDHDLAPSEPSGSCRASLGPRSRVPSRASGYTSHEAVRGGVMTRHAIQTTTASPTGDEGPAVTPRQQTNLTAVSPGI